MAWLGINPMVCLTAHAGPAKTLPRALEGWALDSAGFTEVAIRGGWSLSPTHYAAEARRYADEIGQLEWIAPQDWMCEPVALRATGKDVAEHQRRTVANFLDLRDRAPDLPFVPVIQGYARDEYLRCIELYDRAGVDLASYPRVGVGTVCRRQATDEAVGIIRAIASVVPLAKLHGFGFKTRGLMRLGSQLASADSMAWSYNGRRNPDPSHDHRNTRQGAPRATESSCANCLDFALRWRGRLLDGLAHSIVSMDVEGSQLPLGFLP